MKNKKDNIYKSKIFNVIRSEASKKLINTPTQCDSSEFYCCQTIISNHNESKEWTPLKKRTLNTEEDHNQLTTMSVHQTDHTSRRIDESTSILKKIIYQSDSQIINRIRDVSNLKKRIILVPENSQSSLSRRESLKSKMMKDQVPRFNFDSVFLRENWNPLKGFFIATMKRNEQYYDINLDKKKTLPVIETTFSNLKYDQVDKGKFTQSSLKKHDKIIFEQSSK